MAMLLSATSLCTSVAYAATTGRTSESEANNSISTANSITANSMKYGYLSSTSDTDYYAFEAKVSGYYDITLSVPTGSGCNYDFALYDSTRMLTNTVASASAGVSEITRKYIAAGNTYYIKVYSSSGYSTTKPYTLYISSAAPANKTWFSQVNATTDNCDYNNYNLPADFITKMNNVGCGLTSMAMILHNMNAQTKNKIYDLRTGYTGYMYADPYTVFMARMGTTTTPKSFTSNISLTDTAITDIGTYFNKTAKRYNVSNLADAKKYADSYPQGVVVRFEQTDNSKYPSHYVVLVKSGSNYLIYDPGTTQSAKGNGVSFANLYACTTMKFDETEVTEVITIS